MNVQKMINRGVKQGTISENTANVLRQKVNDAAAKIAYPISNGGKISGEKVLSDLGIKATPDIVRTMGKVSEVVNAPSPEVIKEVIKEVSIQPDTKVSPEKIVEFSRTQPYSLPKTRVSKRVEDELSRTSINHDNEKEMPLEIPSYVWYIVGAIFLGAVIYMILE